MICCVDGCDRMAKGRGLRVMHAQTAGMCDMHAQRMRLYGRLDRLPRQSLEERFWSKVLIPILPQGEFLPEACWEWQNGTNEHGYGLFWFYVTRQMEKAHRVAWMLAHGPITPEQKVLHDCDNPPCVRLDHLRIGTQADNTADAIARGRHVDPPHYTGERNPAWKHGRYAVSS